MARFNYKAVDAAGFPREGVVNATTQQEAVGQLYADNLTPVSLTEERAVAGALGASGGKLRQSDLVALVREIATPCTTPLKIWRCRMLCPD